MPTNTKSIRVFLGSPGDVENERALARKVVARINRSGLLPEGWSLELVAWDSTNYERPTWMHPQYAIDNNLPRPSECDIAVFVFWSRIGTPLPDETHPDDYRTSLKIEEIPLTGSVWEFADAMHVGIDEGKPNVITFKCDRPIPPAPRDRRNETKDQEFAVQDLFHVLNGRFTIESYTSLEEFGDSLQELLGLSISKIIQANANPKKSTQEEPNIDSPIGGLKELPLRADQVTEFVRRFKFNETRGNSLQRELMWYALAEVEPSWREAVFLEYFHDDTSYPGDASWLVRRAIGCVLGELSDESATKINIRDWLLGSPNWIHACVGLIVGRKSVRSSNLKYPYMNILEQDLMVDATWLAFLYLSDHNVKDVDKKALKTSLAKSEWGLIEIWKRQAHKFDSFGEYLGLLLDTGVSKDCLEILATHAVLSGEKRKIIPGEVRVDSELIESPLTKLLYSLSLIGSRHDFGNKWLLRTLFGEWRDSINPRLLSHLVQSLPKETIEKEFEISARLPLAEMRMGVYQYLEEHQETLEAFQKQVSWGLRDNHPWVARSAIRALSKVSDQIFTEPSFNRFVRPGLLDYLLAASELGLNPAAVNCIQNLRPNDISALKHSKVVI